MTPSSTETKQKTILSGRQLIAWLVLILFVLKITSILFIYYFPKSTFFAEISRTLLLKLTNQERKSLGVVTLRESSLLNQAASLKAKDMLKNDYFAHSSPSGLSPWYWFKKVGYNYQYAGENLAIDFVDSEELFNAWDNSPSHRENIVNTNYTDIGIAVVSGDFKGAQTTVVVQFFGSRTIALAKEPTSTSSTRPSSSQESTVTTQVSPSGQTLYGYFVEEGEGYPSFEERAALYEEYDLGSASAYQGTVEQNTALLNALIKGEEAEKPSPKPEPEKPPVTKKDEEETKQKVAEEVTPVETAQEKEGTLYKVFDFLAKYFENIIRNAFLVVFALVIISLSFEFVGQTGINYSNLCLKGTFYTFVLLVLYVLRKEAILQFIPRSLKIF